MMATESETNPNTRRIGGEEGASLTTTSAPLVLDISPIQLASLPERRRAIVNLISTTAQETLIKWDQFTFQLPQSEFVQGHSSGQTLEPLVRVADLCIQPDGTDELAEITIDPETGERRRITTKQYREIVDYGRLSFPSRQFPHVNHVWQFPLWMIRGRKNVAKDFNMRIGHALDHLVVLPHRIYHKPDMWQGALPFLSVGDGIYRIARQMKGIIALFIGLPETVPRRTECRLRKLAERQYVTQKCTNSERRDFSRYVESSPAMARNPRRVADERISAYDETYRIAALRTFRGVSPDDLSTVERVSLIDDSWREQAMEEELGRVMQIEADEQERLVLAEYVRAQHIIKAGESKLKARMEFEKRGLLEDAKRKHPFLSLSTAWLERWILKKVLYSFEEWQRAQEDENIALMRSSDLHRAAKFEESKLEFQREVWPDLRAAWLRDRVPAKVYEHQYSIFNPRGSNEGDVRHVRTTTAHAGWRLVLLWRDTMSYLHNSVYFMVVVNLWQGPLGIQALFRFDDVPYGGVTSSEGHASPQEFHFSMCTRVRAIWRRVEELRTAFEEGEDTVFGKALVRWLHLITNYGFRGGVSTVLVIIGQPLLTILNVAVTAVILGTVVVWAPLSALLTYCTSWLVYDWRAFKRHHVQHWGCDNWLTSYTYVRIKRSPRAFPLISHLLYGVLGVLEACLCAVGLVVHPIYSVFRSTFAVVQSGVRLVWDSMWNLLLRHFGRWPARNSFLAQRVRGVGISGTYFFRLSTDLVKRCLRARLELIELNEAREVIEDTCSKPVRKLEAFRDDLLAGLHTNVSDSETMLKLRSEEEWRLRSINNKFSKREQVLCRLTEIPDNARIRAEKDVSVEDLLESCVEIVEKFYAERIAKLGRLSTELWRIAGAAPGDIKTLTRYLLCDLFSEEFLKPLETTEETLEIPVTFDDVINVHSDWNWNRYGREEA